MHQKAVENIQWLKSQYDILTLIPVSICDVGRGEQLVKRLNEINSAVELNAEVLIGISEKAENLPSLELREFRGKEEGKLNQSYSALVLVSPPPNSLVN